VNVHHSALAWLPLLRPDRVALFDNEGWSVYGAPWLQPVAISSKSDQRKAQEHAKSVAVGCERLLKGAHGKGRVDATSLL
jgi:hypothetical protein